jgi:predicted RNA-binding protein YlxR (DUF448 family)
MKKIPERTCIGCGEKKEKKELIRIVRTEEGGLLPDPTGRRNGRGAYLCQNPACLEKAIKQKALQRSFREEIPTEMLSALQEEFKKFAE